MRRLLPIAIWLAVAATAAVALAQIDDAPAAARVRAIAASGAFEISNSRDGEPIFAATDIAPGGSASGTVTIASTGSAAVAMVLRRGATVDTPGPGGGALSDRLGLSVVDVTVPAAPRTVYSGPQASMPEQAAGELGPGEARTFEFTVTLPDGGAPSLQNSVQGASATVAYEWVAEEASDGGGQVAGVTDDGGPVSRPPALDLTVRKLRRTLRNGRLVVWARCGRSCRLTVRGHLRATAAGTHRGAPLHCAPRRLAPPSARRLRIPVPRSLRRWLQQTPEPARLRAELHLVAVGADGRRDVVHRTMRLRARL